MTADLEEARAGHRSGKVAVVVSGLLLLATIVVTFVFALMNGQWIGQPVAMAVVIAVLVLAWALSRKIAVVVSGLLLLALLVFSAWHSGAWIDVAVMAVAVVLGFAWVRSRGKPSDRPDSELPGRSDGSAAGHHPQPD